MCCVKIQKKMFPYIKKMFTFVKHIKQFPVKDLFSWITVKITFLQHIIMFVCIFLIKLSCCMFVIKKSVFNDKIYKLKKWRQGVWVLCKTNLDR